MASNSIKVALIDSRKRKNNKPRINRNIKDPHTMIESALARERSKTRVVKYFDTYLNANNSTTTIGYTDLTLVPQGVGQAQRLADTIFVSKIDVRLNVTTANADIFAIMRWGIFVWKQNTNSVTPGVSSIYESTATYGVLSPFNFEGRGYFTVLHDELVNLTGTATAPTNHSQYVNQFSFGLGNHRVDYEQAATTGTGHLYFINVSDSSLTPHPVYTIQFRIWYYDE